MQKFTIRDIEHMCGIKAHTLRIWEQRYNFFAPKRKESKHRYYDNEDLKQLLRIAFLYHNGWKISKIADLENEEIRMLVADTNLDSKNYKTQVFKLLEAAISFDELQFKHILDGLVSSIGLEAAVTDVCYPFLQRVGLFWVTNNVIPAQEHFSTYIIQHTIIAAIDSLPQAAAKARTIVLFTPHGEHHELPLLFLNYYFKKNGWRTIYLGSHVAWQQTEEIMKKEEVKYLFLHLITNFTRYDIDDYLEEICRAFPEKIIVASGRSIQAAQRNFVNLIALKSDDAIRRFAVQPDYLGTT